MKIAILRFWYEGNSFSPLITGRLHFESREWVKGIEARQFYKGKGVELGAAVDFLESHEDIDAEFLRCAAAYPAREEVARRARIQARVDSAPSFRLAPSGESPSRHPPVSGL